MIAGKTNFNLKISQIDKSYYEFRLYRLPNKYSQKDKNTFSKFDIVVRSIR